MKEKLPLVINGFTYYKTQALHTAITSCLKLFDLDYQMFLKDFKKKIKDKTNEEIYRQSLAIVQDHNREVTPEEIKMNMYIDCCQLGKKARHPFVPDASTVRTYAREAAHITIQWDTKKKIHSPGIIRRETLIHEAMKLYGIPGEKNKGLKTKIIRHIQKKDRATTAAIQKFVNRYLKRVNGEK